MRIARINDHLIRGYPGKITVLVSLGWLGTLLGREALPPLLPVLLDELAITQSEVGIALSIMWGGYALLHFPAGRLSDAISRTALLVGSLALTGLGVIVLMLAGSYLGFVLSVTAIGLGAGLYFTPSRAYVSDLVVEKRGQALGIQDSAGAIGSALAGILVIAVLELGNWRLHYVLVTAVLLLVLVLLLSLSREERRDERPTLEVRATLKRIFLKPEIAQLVASYSTLSLAWQSTISFLPLFLITAKGIDSTVATLLYSFLFVVASVIGPVAGNLGDRTSRVAVSFAALLCTVVGFASMLLLDPFVFIALGVVLIAVGIRSYSPCMQSYLMELYPEEHRGGDFGAVKTIYTGFGSLGPAYVGLVSDRFDFTVAFAGLAVLLVVGSGFLYRVMRRSG